MLGLLALYFFLVFFNIAGEFLVNFAGFIIPGYYSLDALFSESKTDDVQVSIHHSQDCIGHNDINANLLLVVDGKRKTCFNVDSIHY